jgi:hypothetical protein
MRGLRGSYIPTDRNDEALALFSRAVERSGRTPFFLSYLAWGQAAAGRTEEAREGLAELTARAETEYVSPLYPAIVHAALGEMDRAFELLEEAVRTGNCWLGSPRLPMFDGFRKDPRFVAHLRRISHPDIPDGERGAGQDRNEDIEAEQRPGPCEEALRPLSPHVASIEGSVHGSLRTRDPAARDAPRPDTGSKPVSLLPAGTRKLWRELVVRRSGYSARRAVAGSTRVARQAGTKLASHAVSVSSMAQAASVAGSRASTP